MGDTLPPPLMEIDEADRRRLIQRCTRMRYPADAYIFHGGEAGDTVHMLVSGMVAVWAGGRLGEPIMTNVMVPGEIFGEQALLSSDHRRSATLQAMVRTETLVLRRDDFEDLCRRHPAAQQFLVRVLAERVDRLTRQLVDASELAAPARVFRSLLVLADRFGVLDSVDPIPVTQQMLAAAAGVRLRITNDVLAHAKHEGVLHTARKRISVTNWPELRRRARAA